MFGEDGMLATLNAHKADAPEQLLQAVKDDIARFMGDSPQFDDLTMLCIEYK